VRFDRIRLENFKCYEETELRLDSGVTVIHGLNGSGKSSLLEACFFALYGSKALDKTLDEVVTIGAEETIVELWFTHAGESYHIRRRIRVSNDNARTAECVLEGPDGTTEGATDVRETVVNLLRMDTDAFVNCAYVRQGEVNKLINASPSDRQDMLDDLLQLGKLEEYRERASDARVGVGRVRDDKQGALSEVEDQIAEKESQDLHERRNELRSTLAELESEIERYEENRENAQETLDQAESVIEEYAEKREELDTIEAEISELRERIQETEREREQLAEQISDRRARLSETQERRDDLLADLDLDVSGDATPEEMAEAVQAQIESVQADIEDLTEQITELSVEKADHDGDQERLAEQAEQLEQDAESNREEAEQLASELADARDLIQEKREELTEMAERIEAKRATFEDAPVDFGSATSHHETVSERLGELREERAETAADLENARERLAEAEELLEAGKCPECGQPVEESPHVDAIDEHRERVADLESELDCLDERETELVEKRDRAEELVDLESAVETLERERENLTQLLEEREDGIEEKETRIQQLREEATEAASEAGEKREQAKQAAERAGECQEKIAECNREKATRKERLDRLDTLADVLAERATLEDERETLREQREQQGEVNDERRERLAEKRERRAELEENFDETRIEQAREEKDRAESYLEEVTDKLAELDKREADLQGKLGALENEIEAMEQLRERRDQLDATVEQLDSLYEEAEQLESMYGTLRAELRQRNIETLERMVNETFELVYENDTYSRIELDGEYRLTVYQKDGEALDPEQLSGGERALFNLSLRCAIYQLLAEGIEGTAPMPPLILDEPTVFLDSGHVSQLVELIDAMRELGVEQILVVSHDEELVGAADDLVTVRKDSTTNRSTVERGEALEERLLAEAND
jgi:exonuclease SbcC